MLIISVIIIAREMIVRAFNTGPLLLPSPSLVVENAAEFGLVLVPRRGSDAVYRSVHARCRELATPRS